MILITLEYVPLNLKVSFLQLKVQSNLKHYQVAFFTHVYSSIFVLFLGFFQFLKPLRLKFPKAHKLIGYLYVILVLILSSPSGLIMGYYGEGGIYSQISFCIQAVLWFMFTFLALNYAKTKKFTLHQKYMILSYAMTLTAISLRLFKWIIISIWQLPPMDTYKIVVWAAWLFNLVVAFLILNFKKKV